MTNLEDILQIQQVMTAGTGWYVRFVLNGRSVPRSTPVPAMSTRESRSLSTHILTKHLGVKFTCTWEILAHRGFHVRKILACSEKGTRIY